jgi:hypothetical protein
MHKLVQQAHGLWQQVEEADDPVAIKECFKLIAQAERLLNQLRQA